MKNKNDVKTVNFDEYAAQYENLLQEQLAFFSRDRDYFSEYKVAIAAEICKTVPKRVLDFGGGVGLSLSFLSSYFPSSQIYISDLSEESLKFAKKNNPAVTALYDSEIDEHKFDLIYVTGVFHHIQPAKRSNVLGRLVNMLNDGGRLIIFEHNPYNPVTRHMVNTCPFDEDAELISLSQLKRFIQKNSELVISDSGYCLFFPQILKVFRPIEKYLYWLPAGGQYFASFEK